MSKMDAKVAQYRVTGVCAATFQTFNQDGSLNLAPITVMAEGLVKQGVKYAFPCGTTGEGVTMTVEERKTVLEAWIKAAAGRIDVIAHVGAESAPDVEALAKHAEKAGAAAISAMPPTFYKPEGGLDAVLSFVEWTCSLTSLPFYYYHIPARTGVAIRPDHLLERISAAVDGAAAAGKRSALASFRGIKYSDGDQHLLSRCISVGVKDAVATTAAGLPSTAKPRYDILFGSDEQLIGAACLGCTGAVGSTYNYVGQAGNEVLACVAKSDVQGAVLAQRKVQAVVQLLVDAKALAGPLANPMAVQKLLTSERLRALGLATELGGPRQPWNGKMTDEGRKRIVAALEDMGFPAWQ